MATFTTPSGAVVDSATGQLVSAPPTVAAPTYSATSTTPPATPTAPTPTPPPQNVSTGTTAPNTGTPQDTPITPPTVSSNLQPGSTGKDVAALQNYLVQMGYLTPDQLTGGQGTYGPKTTAAVAQLQQQLGIQAGTGSGDYGPQTQAALAQKYTQLHKQLSSTTPTDSAGTARTAITTATDSQTPTDPYFGAMQQQMAPILQSLVQVMSNINNPALTAVSLQQEYNDLATQNNLPQMQAELLNWNNVMNGSEQDIRDEITKSGGFATDSQVLAMSAARNKVILKQYNAVASQYQAATTNVQNQMQFASTDQQTQLQRQTATAGIAQSLASIESQMANMGLTMRQNAVSAAQYNIGQTGYQAFAKTLVGNPAMQSNYESLLGLAPGTLSSPTALASLDTYKQQSLQMTNLLRDTQLYNAGLINQLPSSDTNYLQGSSPAPSTGTYGTATSTISQATGIDPNTPLSQVDPSSLVPAIIQNEGGSPQGVQNNPGNIKYAGLPGQTNSGVQAQDGGTFASYPTPESGQQAILANIQAAQQNNPNQTLGSFVDRYTNTAPQYNAVSGGGGSITAPIIPITNNGSGSQALYTGSLIPPTAGGVGARIPKAITAITGLTTDQFNYAVKGQPALTRMPFGQQKKVKQGWLDYANSHGVDVSTFQSQYEAYNTTLGNNIQRFNNTQIAEGEVMGTLKNLDPSSVKAGFGSVNLANVAKILGGENVNDPTANEYTFYFNDLINSLGYFYAAQQGKTSADIPDKTEAAQVIKGGLASGGIQGLRTAMTQTTLKMKGVLATAVDASQKNVWNLFGVGDKYTPLGVKGQMNDKTFVESTLSDQGIAYNSALSKVAPGKIGAINNETGELVQMDPSEFNASLYTRL